MQDEKWLNARGLAPCSALISLRKRERTEYEGRL